jgi:hypothetical protein
MIPKGVQRFSEKIMLKLEARRDAHAQIAIRSPHASRS